ncbi:MAG TPA: zf-HC2 domain-containing protein [Gemmatimonadales bacterium]|jgi:anti-sigma factor (TIGR02949 family)|nr:zf-HC2 domain-containing protein [Gemmatimonadales bacterium]
MTHPDSISCEEALRHLAAFLDGELPLEQQGEVDAHLRRCLSCYSRAEFERRLKARLAALGSANPGPGLEQRIRAMLARVSAR